MKAGRELDALIAEKVMGWIYDEETDAFHDGYIGIRVDEFKPSERIADAWLVVEKLREKKIYMDILNWSDGYGARIEKEDEEFKYSRMTGLLAETAPLAICLAALKAVGVEVE